MEEELQRDDTEQETRKPVAVQREMCTPISCRCRPLHPCSRLQSTHFPMHATASFDATPLARYEDRLRFASMRSADMPPHEYLSFTGVYSMYLLDVCAYVCVHGR